MIIHLKCMNVIEEDSQTINMLKLRLIIQNSLHEKNIIMEYIYLHFIYFCFFHKKRCEVI